MNTQALIAAALAARAYSYSPYSGFAVGAALLAQDGRVYTGCNIENAAYSPTNCAERTAFFKAVSEGNLHFQAIAIVGGCKDAPLSERDFCAPCGVCRQVMAEFCDAKTFQVILAKSETDYQTMSLEALLPLGFTNENLVK